MTPKREKGAKDLRSFIQQRGKRIKVVTPNKTLFRASAATGNREVK
eukprot:CAMPEP_0176155708 /NCGR_PEP_ID=MMETSP0120_2-20121206/79578_1 /TAXON_ID=160619 /ORGANISM="Kryptoperidinium foliaceum, Strain CCMP 1326" /LENGTH=45 /DNA_ID= /DNA_START= /DNA_END= /DNA_ORIENTATION=